MPLKHFVFFGSLFAGYRRIVSVDCAVRCVGLFCHRSLRSAGGAVQPVRCGRWGCSSAQDSSHSLGHERAENMFKHFGIIALLSFSIEVQLRLFVFRPFLLSFVSFFLVSLLETELTSNSHAYLHICLFCTMGVQYSFFHTSTFWHEFGRSM